MSLLYSNIGGITRAARPGRVSSIQSALTATVPNSGRSCLSVQCRRMSQQTHLLRRPAALPRNSRESALRSRSFSTTLSGLSAQPARAKPWKQQEGPDGPDINLLYVKVGDGSWHPTFLRDACICPLCVDPSTKQKIFQTTDIPADLEAKSVKEEPNGDVTITWTKDIPGFDSNHVSTIPAALLKSHLGRGRMRKARYSIEPVTWGAKKIADRLEFIEFHEYMHDDQRLWHALQFLERYGILLVRGVPDSEGAIEDLTSRIGIIRDTFYGRTWDVKSVPNAKNVAYTPQHLGLHMDLLYMQNPPGYQFLHCLKNTSPGGTSIFSDALNAARALSNSVFNTLATQSLAYEYRNDGQHYYQERPVLEVGRGIEVTKQFGRENKRAEILNINWSPPFQAPLPFQRMLQGVPLPRVLAALRNFGAKIQHPAALFQYRLSEGECVIFNNRRILHGRTAFDATQGERWLKGTYVDTDALQSRIRVLSERFHSEVDVTELRKHAKYVNPRPKVENVEESQGTPVEI